MILGTWIRKEVVRNSVKPDGVWDTTAEDMMLEIAETSHPMFRASSAFERVELRGKGGGQEDYSFQR